MRVGRWVSFVGVGVGAFLFLARQALGPEPAVSFPLRSEPEPVSLVVDWDGLREKVDVSARGPWRWLWGSGGQDASFPVPEELEPAVAFWTRVYSEWGKDTYVVHDRETLAVIAQLDLARMPDNPRLRQAVLDSESRVYEQRLRELARKLGAGVERKKLSAEETRWMKRLGSRDPSAYEACSKRLRVQRGQRDQFEAGLRRAGRYMRHIQEILRAKGLPEDLAYLPHVESSFNERAVSVDGASGVWQFIRSAAQGRLKISRELDERNDPFRATEAAASLLAHNYKRTGSWPLALTAYNHGLTGILRAAAAVGSMDLGKIARRYNSESFGFASKNFYAEFLAARRVAKDARRYFPDVVPEPPLVHEVVRLEREVSLKLLAKRLGVSLETLQPLNLGLRKEVWEGKRLVPRGYELRVPPSLVDACAQLLDEPPPPAPAKKMEVARAAEKKAKKEKKDRLHTIRNGETLSAIAKRYKTSVPQILACNALPSAHRLKVGQKLRIPVAS